MSSSSTLIPPLPQPSSSSSSSSSSSYHQLNQNSYQHHLNHQPLQQSTTTINDPSVPSSSFINLNNSKNNNNRFQPHPPPNPHHPQPYLNPSQPNPIAHQLNNSNTLTVSDSRTQLFVGNLPYRVRWQDLKDLFRKAGTVLRTDVSLTPENRSKGFGTVLFANRNDALRAIEIYNGFNWQTRTLDVRLDQQDPTGSLATSIVPTTNNHKVNSQSQPHPQYNHHPHRNHHHHHNHHHHPNHGQSHNHPLNPQSTVHQFYHPHQHQQFSSSSSSSSSSSPYPQPPLPHQHPNLPPSLPSAQRPYSPTSSVPPLANNNEFDQTKAVETDSIPPQPASTVPASPPAGLPSESAVKTDIVPPAVTVRQSSIDVAPPANKPSPGSIPNLLAPSTDSSDISNGQSSKARSTHSALTSDLSRLTIGSISSNSSPILSSRPLDALQPAFLPASLSGTPPINNQSSSLSNVPGAPEGNVQFGNYPPGPSPYHAQSIPHQNSGPPPQMYSQVSFQANGSNSNGENPSLLQANAGSDRHLFVGNLPFNFQWQDLKDLFRQAGNILRADVALGPDGRSRGFGTVLFATSEDAEQARRMYDGYALRGRTLKVHVDRFSQPSGNNHHHSVQPPTFQQSFYPNQCLQIPPSGLQPSLMSPSGIAGHESRQKDHSAAHEESMNRDRERARSELWAGEPVEVTPSGLPAGGISPIASRRPSQFKAAAEKNSQNDQGSKSGPQPIGHPHNNNIPKPQSIPMPPPYDLAGALHAGTMSPTIPKLVQITPSMPAFSFQPLPSTPPLLPQFFSPGIGPSLSNAQDQAAPGEKEDEQDENQVDGEFEKFQESTTTAGGLNYNPMFPIEDERERMSNVDWGYHSQPGGNRRASFFVGAGLGHGNGNGSEFSGLGLGNGVLGGGGGEAGDGLRFGLARQALFGNTGLSSHLSNRRASFDISSLNPRVIKQANERRNRKNPTEGPGGGMSVDDTSGSTRLKVEIGAELEEQKEEEEEEEGEGEEGEEEEGVNKLNGNDEQDWENEDRSKVIGNVEVVGLGLTENVWEAATTAKGFQK